MLNDMCSVIKAWEKEKEKSIYGYGIYLFNHCMCWGPALQEVAGHLHANGK